MHFFISAGEASGDLHAADLIGAIRKECPEARFTFLGGDEMARQAGHQPLIHYRRMAYMGFIEVIKNLRNVAANLHVARQAINSERPDAVILVDYPSFNLRLAREAYRLGIPVFYYISPKVWAWKEHRVTKLRQLTTRILSILPFEVDWYRSRHGMEVDYVGNPSVAEVDRRLAQFTPISSPDGRPILALVPGSRRAEVLSNLPVMIEVARRHPELCPIIAAAPGLPAELFDRFPGIHRVEGTTFELMASAKAALVTSGTATLEAALIGVPQVVCYRNNGSRLAYHLFRHILHIDYVSLPNLIVGREIVAEKLLHHCNADEVDAALTPLLTDAGAQQAGYAEMRRILGSASAPDTAASIILSHLG